jgi:hypothetical protein
MSGGPLDRVHRPLQRMTGRPLDCDRYRFMIGDRLVDFSEVSLDQQAPSR